MVSGIKVVDQVKTSYQNLKMSGGNSAGKKHRYMVCKVASDKKSIEVEREEPVKADVSLEEEFNLFKHSLPEDDCRYVVYDVSALDKDGSSKNNLLLISWNPQKSPIQSKMLYASTKENLKKILDGLRGDYQVGDETELVYSEACLRAGIKIN